MTWALESFKNFHFNGLLLSKVYIVQAKKVQRSFLSWNWRGTQNLERNWPVVSKLTWGIWQILTWALKSLNDFHLNGLLLSKVYIVWTKRVERCYLSWHWRVMQLLKKNPTCCLENDMWDLVDFHKSTWKCQNWNSDGTLLPKVENVWP